MDESFDERTDFLLAPTVVLTAEEKAEVINKLTCNNELTLKERIYLFQYFSAKSRSMEPPKTTNKKEKTALKETRTFKSVGTQFDESNLEEFGEDYEEEIDVKEVQRLMERSFNKRREQVVKENLLIALLKEKYPLLFNRLEIINEFDRIYQPGQAKKFILNITKYALAVHQLFDENDPLAKLVDSEVNNRVSRNEQRYVLEVGSLLIIPKLMEEKMNFLCLSDMVNFESKEFVVITCDVKEKDLFNSNLVFKIFAEKTLICEVNNFKEAILCLVATYLIFNIKFPACDRKTLKIYKYLYLEADDTATDELSVLKHAMEMINKNAPP